MQPNILSLLRASVSSVVIPISLQEFPWPLA